MAYYNKQEVIDYVESNLKEMESKGLSPLNPKEEVLMKLGNEEDMIGFFWVEYDEEGDGPKIILNGKAYVRVDHDIYTDDRFAIDLYESAKMGVTVSDIIKKRGEERELASQGLIDSKSLEEGLGEKIKGKGEEKQEEQEEKKEKNED